MNDSLNHRNEGNDRDKKDSPVDHPKKSTGCNQYYPYSSLPHAYFCGCTCSLSTCPCIAHHQRAHNRECTDEPSWKWRNTCQSSIYCPYYDRCISKPVADRVKKSSKSCYSVVLACNRAIQSIKEPAE